MSFRGEPVLDWSPLGLAFEASAPLGPSVRIGSSVPSSADETWKPVQGKASTIRNHYNAVFVTAVETGSEGRKLVLEARAYDHGAAFRYVLPEQSAVREARILNEATRFRFAKEGTGLRPEYLINLPLLMHLPGVAWIALTEADIEKYSSLFVTGTGSRELVARLATRVEGVETDVRVAPSFEPKADAAKLSVIAKPRCNPAGASS